MSDDRTITEHLLLDGLQNLRVDVREVKEQVQRTSEDHEARLRVLETDRTKRSDRRGAMVAGVVSVVLAALAHLVGCAAPPAEHPTVDQRMAQETRVVRITGTTEGPLGLPQDYVGTGTFVAPSLVLTAGHMCDPGDMFTARTWDGTEVIAVPVYAHTAYPDDVCVMRVFGYESPVVSKLGAAPSQWEHVWYVGYPDGMLSAYDGYISALVADPIDVDTGDGVTEVTGYTQVSMPLAGGASGSAVLDDAGRVVGIVSAGNNDFHDQGWIVPYADVARAFQAAVPSKEN